MKGLVIENEFTVDESVQAFLKDNPTLFTEVDEQLYCLQRGLEEMKHYILENDAIIVASTFMYKDQLEDYLDAFLNPKFPKKMTFYIHGLIRKLNGWKYDSIWSDEKELFEKVKQLMENGHKIYEFGEDYDAKEVVDDLNFSHKERSRHMYTEQTVKYSKEHDLFYTGKYDLKDLIKEFKNKKEK